MKDYVIVTGANGFIGRALTDYLRKTYRVLALVGPQPAPTTPTDADWQQYIELHTDPKHWAEWPTSIPPVAVFHCAAVARVPYCEEHADEAFDVNVQGTYRLLDTLKKKFGLPPLFVYVSTMQVWGETTMEDQPPNEPMNVYARTKSAGELMVRSFFHGLGMDFRYRIVRLPNVYGPGSGCVIDKWIANHVKDVQSIARVNDAGTYPSRTFLHVDDACKALLSAMLFPEQHATTNEPGFTFEVGSHDTFCLHELLEWFYGWDGRDMKKEPLPDYEPLVSTCGPEFWGQRVKSLKSLKTYVANAVR
jgi:nucleoside-diphosphate-sugar epimerase